MEVRQKQRGMSNTEWHKDKEIGININREKKKGKLVTERSEGKFYLLIHTTENRCSLGPLLYVFSALNFCILAADAHARQVIMDRKLNSNPAEIYFCFF